MTYLEQANVLLKQWVVTLSKETTSLDRANTLMAHVVMTKVGDPVEHGRTYDEEARIYCERTSRFSWETIYDRAIAQLEDLVWDGLENTWTWRM